MPSQAVASSSAKCKADRPPGNFISGQSSTMCDSLWRCTTGTGWIWSLIPADEVGCTSTLASSKVVQHWPQAST